VERLEGRALLHGGHVARHVAALVRRNAPPPADPTAALQQALAAASTQPPGGVISVQTRDATILVPTGIVPGRTYPLVATFSWDGNPITEFQAWWNLAKENGWFVYASRDYQNSVLRSGFGPSEKVATRVKAQLDALPGTLPIDTSRIIFSGFSGGANFADFMNLRFPGYAAAVIINSGEIPALFRKTPRRGAAPMPTAASFDGSRKLGVFLCSPSDGQFYGITQANAKLMESLGWQTLFLSFPGGHSIAPPSTYNQALSWIESQPSWSAANP
jgi:predicted esterase